MSVEHNLPAELYFNQGIQVGETRKAFVAQYDSGPSTSRTYWDRERRTYRGSFIAFPGDGSNLERWRVFLRQIEHRKTVFWINDQVSENHRHMLLETANGTRSTYVLPVMAATNVGVFDDEVWVGTGLYTVHSVCNRLTDLQANATSGTGGISAYSGVSGTTPTVARHVYESCDGLTCFLVTAESISPIPTNQGLRVTPANTVAVTAGREYTGMASFRARVDANKTGVVAIQWFDGSKVYISESSASGTFNATTWTQVTKTATAPSGAAFAGIRASMTDAATAPFYVGCLGLAPGDLTRWFLPSASPSAVEWTGSPVPASGSILTAYATGKRVCAVRLSDEATVWTYTSMGHARVTSFEAVEEWQ